MINKIFGSIHKNRFRFIDLFVILLCLSGAMYCIILFRADLVHTIHLNNVSPVGIVAAKNNIIQRRIENRVLWDRLNNGAPVYLGDLIRVAEFSSATLDIEGQKIFINENSLVRILRTTDDSGAIQVELSDGSLAVVTTPESGAVIHLSIMDRIIEASPNSSLNVSSSNEGVVLQVNEGTAQFIEEGVPNREIVSGAMIAIDSEGEEQHEAGAVVLMPRHGVRYLKSTPGPFSVEFNWNRINLGAQELLRLEVAADRHFNRITRTINNLQSSAVVALDTGSWYWRLSFQSAVLSSGELAIVDALGPQLLSPINLSQVFFTDELPAL